MDIFCDMLLNHFTSFKVSIKNIFKNNTVQMESIMVNVKYTKVKLGLLLFQAEYQLTYLLH